MPVEYKMAWPLGKTVSQFLVKPKLQSPCESPCDPAILFLRVYPGGMKPDVRTKASALLSIAILFETAPNWKPPEYLAIGEWLTKHPYRGILFGDKIEQTIDTHNNLDGSQRQYADWKRNPTSKDLVPCDFVYMTF